MPEVFIIWDTFKRKLWVSNRGRVTWTSPRLAVLGYEASTGKNFRNQVRYQCHVASLVRGMMVDSKEITE